MLLGHVEAMLVHMWWSVTKIDRFTTDNKNIISIYDILIFHLSRLFDHV